MTRRQRERLAVQVRERHVGREPQLRWRSPRSACGASPAPRRLRFATSRASARRAPRFAACLRAARRCGPAAWAGRCGRTAGSAARNRAPGKSRSACETWSPGHWCWQDSAACRAPRSPAPIESCRPRGRAGVEKTGSESKRGRQHQTISPLLCTSAENWQFPIKPSASSLITRTLARPAGVSGARAGPSVRRIPNTACGGAPSVAILGTAHLGAAVSAGRAEPTGCKRSQAFVDKIFFGPPRGHRAHEGD